MPAVGNVLGVEQIEPGLSPSPMNRQGDKGPPVCQVCRVEWRLQGYRLMAAPCVRQEVLAWQVQLPCFEASFNFHDYSGVRKDHKMEAGSLITECRWWQKKERKKSCHSHFSDSLSLLLPLFHSPLALPPFPRSSSSDVPSVKGLPLAERSIVQPAHLLHWLRQQQTHIKSVLPNYWVPALL